MSFQIIKSVDGQVEYVLLPISVYEALSGDIKRELKKNHRESDYVSFKLTDYVDNPVALARIEADVTQEELAKHMKVTQAYISKIENQKKVSAKVLRKTMAALREIAC